MNVHIFMETIRRHLLKSLKELRYYYKILKEFSRQHKRWSLGIAFLIVNILIVLITAYELTRHVANNDNDEKDKVKFVQLSQESLKLADVEVQAASEGVIIKELEATGEVTPNGDTLTHVKPSVSGIVVDVLKNIGDKVVKGEPLAVMVSPDLGKAKIDYFSAKQNLDLARMDLDREKKVYDNTVKLLDVLESDNENKEVGKIDIGSIGDNKSKLLTAYAARRQAKAAKDRALKLRERDVVSQASTEITVKEYESAQAGFKGVFEDISFSHKSRYVQAERAMQVAETTYRNAKRYLHILGLTEDEIGKMSSEKDDEVARFVLKAPMNGTIIEKHISIGERIKDEVDYPDCFVIADLSSLWVNINVYISNMDLVRPLQPVNIEIAGHEKKYSGKLHNINPTVSEKTRTATARVVLDNAEGKLKPGLFASARVIVEEIKCPVLVPLDAVQTIDGLPSVFVQSSDNKFLIQPVALGAKDSSSYEIKEGLKAGTPVVVKNAFSLRTEFDKAGLEVD